MRLFFYQVMGFCTLGLALVGCQIARDGGGKGALSLPADKQVRILSREIASRAGAAPGGLHQKWTILGERNWTVAQMDELAGSLKQTYPLNDTQRKGGCNTWEYDLIAERVPNNLATLHWTVTLHGSNGMTARSEGVTPLAGGEVASVNAVVQIVESQDSVSGLPANLTLARVGDKPITLHIEP